MAWLMWPRPSAWPAVAGGFPVDARGLLLARLVCSERESGDGRYFLSFLFFIFIACALALTPTCFCASPSRLGTGRKARSIIGQRPTKPFIFATTGEPPFLFCFEVAGCAPGSFLVPSSLLAVAHLTPCFSFCLGAATADQLERARAFGENF